MSVLVKENLQEKLSAVVNDLSVEKIAEVIDFAEFLRKKNHRQEEKPISNERIAGLNQGEIWMSEDFTDELPDEFWLGGDAGRNVKTNELAD